MVTDGLGGLLKRNIRTWNLRNFLTIVLLVAENFTDMKLAFEMNSVVWTLTGEEIFTVR